MQTETTIYSRDEHSISRKNISDNALKVLYRLKACGFQAHLVGGGVRDLLLGNRPKDFDVATDATPEDVRAAFRNCRLIGRRFRLAHVRFGPEIIEVATFRGSGDDGDRELEEGRLLRDNIFGSIEEDAIRRDFTVNALYYNIADFSVRDDVGGMADLRARLLRLIGDPEERFREDPVRILRAARFAAKLDFEIETATRQGMTEHAGLLDDIPPARLFDETLKLFMSGHALRSFDTLQAFDLTRRLFPGTTRFLANDEGLREMVRASLRNTDQRIAEDQPVTPAFLFAVMLWQPMHEMATRLRANGMSAHDAIHAAADKVLSHAYVRPTLPRRFATPMREIWLQQPRLEGHTRARPKRIIAHPRFRAAYDFLLMRQHQDPALKEVCEYWTEAQQGADAPPPDGPKRKKRRRRGGRGRRGKPAAA